MALIDQINKLMARLRPAQPKTTSDEITPQRKTVTYAELYQKFQVERDRESVVKDCRKMYDEDSRVKGFISTLARDAVKGGFTVAVTDASDVDGAQEASDDLIKRLNLFTRLDDWCRLSFRDGDSFLENSIDRAGLIAQVTRKPTIQMHRNCNKIDRFDDPTQAYWYADMYWPTQAAPADAVWFADWQIIHARFDHDEGSKYGRPLFASARKAHKRVDEGETDIAIRRKTRAGMKYHHQVEGPKTAVQEYMEINKATLDEPLAAIQDFFGGTKIEAVQGDARLAEIGDVEHHIETFAVASPVPLTLIGYGKALNRDILEQKLEQYDRALEQVTQWVTDQIVKPLLELQWLLLGYWPDNMEYSIKWASKKTITPAYLESVAGAGIKLRALGWPDEIIVEILAPLVPGLDPERLLAAMAAVKAGQPDEIDRIANDANRK